LLLLVKDVFYGKNGLMENLKVGTIIVYVFNNVVYIYFLHLFLNKKITFFYIINNSDMTTGSPTFSKVKWILRILLYSMLIN